MVKRMRILGNFASLDEVVMVGDLEGIRSLRAWMVTPPQYQFDSQRVEVFMVSHRPGKYHVFTRHSAAGVQTYYNRSPWKWPDYMGNEVEVR